MSNKLFATRTYSLPMPAPFDDAGISRSRSDIKSTCRPTQTNVPLHPPTLRAALAIIYSQNITEGVSNPENASIGRQGNFILVERECNDGSIEAVVYDTTTGSFRAAVFSDPSDISNPGAYTLGASNGAKDGVALLIAAIYHGMDNSHGGELSGCMDAVEEHLFGKEALDANGLSQHGALLCDNILTRITSAETLGNAGIKISLPSTSNVQLLTRLAIEQGTYALDKVFFGSFRVFKTLKTKNAECESVCNDELRGKYAFSSSDAYSLSERNLIPHVPDWYVVPKEVIRISQHALKTTTSNQSMRNFMLRGPAGVGKTEGARTIAAALSLPYLSLTCSANTEIFDLLGQILPDVEGMDGEVSSVAELQDDEASRTNSSGQKFRYVETPLVKAMKYGYLIEIQEPSVIANPGVLVGLNSLLDNCKQITLPTGETISRHPDTVVVVTTNNDYSGCRDMNQSVISRMNLIMDIDEPSQEDLVARVTAVTGCDDEEALNLMASVVKDIQIHCRENMITDGCCGVREFMSWAQSYMVTNDLAESVEYTVLSSVSACPENREFVKTACITPKIGVVA